MGRGRNMFNLSGSNTKKFEEIYVDAQKIRCTTDMYYNNLRLLHYMKTFFVTQEIYDDLYDGILSDIELVSLPIDTVIPNMTEYPKDEEGNEIIPEDYTVCVLNDAVPEYEKITHRVTTEDILKNTEPSHPLHVALIDNPENIKKIINDVFKFFLIRRYFVQIEMLHMAELSSITPIIEYIVKNITAEDIKKHIVQTKINMKKAVPALKETIFMPDFGRVKAFYAEDSDVHEFIDVENLIFTLITNKTITSDMYIISAMFHILSFAMVDFAKHQEEYNTQKEQGIEEPKIEFSECEKYINEVLAKF